MIDIIDIKRIMLAALALSAALTTGCANSNGDGSSYFAPDTTAAISEADENSDGAGETLGADTLSEESSVENSDGNNSENENENKNENESEIYDVAPIAEAYRNNDPSGLDADQLAIFGKASQVIEECITDDMDDYEKELALHDWLIYNCTYDKGALRAIERPGKHASDPYGALIDGEAICMGYTTTFKLFMDMVDIPCNIIHSKDTDGDEHAWNTVQLGGNWYYVDTTWDDPVPDRDSRLPRHTYFNITREEIAERHILPDDAPQTDSTDELYSERQLWVISDVSELSDAVAEAAEQGRADAAVYFDNGTKFERSMGLFSSGETYTFEDKELFKAVCAECREAGCQFSVSYLRKCSKGNALLIIFDKD